MRILIAGGGIGGLAASLACSIGGNDVQLFERSPEFAEVGAGIQLGPNAVKLLHGWGLADALTSVAAFPDCLQVRSALTGSVLGKLGLGKAAVERYGYPYATVHRADLHGLLLAALQPYPQTTLRRNVGVASFVQDAGGVTLQPGAQPDGPSDAESPVHGDVLVGADGLWSRVRSHLLNDGPPMATGHLAYRALIPQPSLPAALRSGHITAWLGPKLHVVQYPVRGGAWLNVVGIVHGRVDGSLDNWNHAANASALRGALAGMCPPLQDLILAIDNWRLWALCRRTPMRGAQQQARGRVALLGDAAHPMLPYLAQGAGMAIEDAAELGRCLDLRRKGNPDLDPDSDIPARLQHYARARWQRNARVQKRALRNGQIFHATGLVRWARDLSMKWGGERLMDMPWLYESPGITD
jgi:salicylate hydroxylase